MTLFALVGVDRFLRLHDPAWRTMPEERQLEDQEVHLWGFALDKPEMEIAALEKLISANERQRASRYVFEPDRRRFIVRRGVLRRILARYLAVDPVEVEYYAGQQGKLYVGCEDGQKTFDFSLTHSHGHALVAIARGQRVGVDLEFVRDLSDLESLIAQCCAPHEVRALDAICSNSRLRGFFMNWTAKEACLKASGEGLSRRMDSVRLTWESGEGAAKAQLKTSDRDALYVQSFAPFEGHLAAIALEWKPARLECFAI